MRFLICTQKIDSADPILGFFHRWLAEFAKYCESIVVICLEEGEHALPRNVRVHSLGKQHSVLRTSAIYRTSSRVHYAWRFVRYVVLFRKEYDAVFVHMNPEYVVFGGVFWKMWGKRIGLWYNHTVGSVWLTLAAPFTWRIFHTSPFAVTSRFRNAQRMPAGIDTDVFKPHPEIAREPGTIYFQGRIAPAKNVHVLLDAFAHLFKEGKARQLTLVGPEEPAYARALKERYAELLNKGAITFLGPRRNEETPALYAAHSLSVNLTSRGNYDKTVLESLACGTPCIVLAGAFDDIIPEAYRISEASSDALAEAVMRVISLVPDTAALRAAVERHSLSRLAQALMNAYQR